MHCVEWEKLSPAEKKEQLYWNQKRTLDAFLERRAISKEQYEKSLGDLTEKMGMRDKFQFITAPTLPSQAAGSGDWRNRK